MISYPHYVFITTYYFENQNVSLHFVNHFFVDNLIFDHVNLFIFTSMRAVL